MPLAAYCGAYGRWRIAEETLAGIAANDPVMSGLLVRSPDGNARINPLVRIAAKAAEDMVRFASEFGMTPAARSRIAAGVCGLPDAGKFSGLLGGSDAFRN
jgi:P27 family predicted phage terminase small subunit